MRKTIIVNNPGRPYSLREQIKGFLVFVVFIGVLILGLGFLNEKRSIIETGSGTGNLKPKEFIIDSWEYVVSTYYGDGYPGSVELRSRYISDFLYYNSDLSETERNNLVAIAGEESTAHDPSITPKTFVKHCRKSSGGYYAVELKDGKQASCNEGDQEVYSERSVGIFQILPSTFKQYKCTGSIENAEDQIRCAVVIYRRSGYNAWFNSSKELGII